MEWQSSAKPPKSMGQVEHNINQIGNKNDEFKIVCYFTNWAWYRQSGGRFVPEDIDSELCTHIIYGFAVLDGSTLKIKPHDSWADLDNSKFKIIKFLSSVINYIINISLFFLIKNFMNELWNINPKE